MRTRRQRLLEAQRCERDAEAAHSEQLSLVLRRIAEQWRVMANTSQAEVVPGCVGLMEIGADLQRH
jgi:hypothetical protein